MLVRDLVTDPELRLELRVSGALDRPVRWVHTTEVADPARFLRGGEVVLTAGVWRDGGLGAGEFVDRIAAAGVAAVGYGLLPDTPDVPEEFLAAARRQALTCFVVPVEVPFVQITEAFVAVKRAEWERPLRGHLAEYDAIVAALRRERGVHSVLRVLAKHLGLPVAVRTAAGVFGEPPEARHGVALVGDGLADAELLLPVPFAELEVRQRASVTQAMPFLALEIERVRALRETESRFAAELFEWIQAGSPQLPAVRSRLRSLGLPPDAEYAGLVVHGSAPEALAARLAEALHGVGVCAVRGEEVLGLITVDGDPDRQAATLHGALGEAGLGIGGPGPVDSLRASLLQAAHAVAALRGEPGRLSYARLSSPTLLFAAQDPELLEATSRAVLGGVAEHDRRRGSELLPSLRVFLDCGGRWQEAAQSLHVHINTLRHRIGKVEELTGRSLGDTADRVDLYLALRALPER
ncbi:helix-turn-helix domain-containing protein [Sciscionella marina]|uniref:helix-turn-helix domain-containing protein n=1 Tax=Sciscionella marina TaxID=508770 RepID=UPI00037BBC1E|nr:helix-turn-helix domain-containing protein [Sciscionella marina]